MPPPVSNRWDYFKKGEHPNPPTIDGRNSGQPHTPIHPCSNPKLFWVQCKFCIERNGGNFLEDQRAWMKSREEQMMHHLKTCCPESMKIWEEIIEWKATRKTGGAAAAAATNSSVNSNNKRPLISASVTGINSATGKPVIFNKNRKVRKMAAANKGDGEGSVDDAAFNPTSSTKAAKIAATASGSRAPTVEATKMNPTQLRNFHKICTMAVASQKLDLNFFEDPVIQELFLVVRPGLVANHQLPKKHQLLGYFEKHSMEQVKLDLSQIARSLKRYEGLKAAVVCNLRESLEASYRAGAMPPSTLVCSGTELSCRVVPAMHGILKQNGEIAEADCSVALGDIDAAVALASAIEAQLKAASTVLGRAIIGDERETMKLADKAGESTTDPISQDASIQEEAKIQQSAGFSHIGSCLLTTFASGTQLQSKTLPPGTIASAHRIVALRWPMIFFTSHGCLEEQLNLLLKDLLTEIPAEDFLVPLKQAFAILRALQKPEEVSGSSPSNKKFYDEFLKAVNQAYFGGEGRPDQVGNLVAWEHGIQWSSWTCAQRALALLLRLKTACNSFADHFSLEESFPEELQVLSDSEFWEKLERAEILIRPITVASLKFVPNQGSSSGIDDGRTVEPTMADMVHTFQSLFHALQSNGFPIAAKLVERRWSRFEQPWMLLAFVLHPAYSKAAMTFLKKQSQEDGLFSVKYLSNAVLGYTIKYLAAELTADPPLSIPLLKRQASEYLDRVERGEMNNDTSTMQMKKDWKEYWTFQTSSYPELSKFALFLLSVTVQGSTADDMFLSLAAKYLDVDLDEDNRHRIGQGEMLKEHLQIIEKATKPLVHKWQHGRGKPPPRKSRQVLNPAEPLPEGQTGGTDQPQNQAAVAATKAASKSPSAPDENGIEWYDQETQRKKSIVEEKASSKFLSGTSPDNDTTTTGTGGNISIPEFWLRVLALLDDSDDEEFVDATEVQDDEYDRAPEVEDNAGRLDDEDGDDDMPQFTVPAYAKASTSSHRPRKVRRTYRPEQVNFDFMRGWTDERDQPLTSTTTAPGEENVSQLKNYRANKIRLNDFFPADQVPASSTDSMQF